MENKQQFKPFDKVLVRDMDGTWRADIYSHFSNQYSQHYLLSLFYKNDSEILPYEGNEHLVGTTDEPEEEIELKEGEWLMVSDEIEDIPGVWQLRYFLGASGDKICIQSVRFAYPDPCPYSYAIRFSDFNPNDMKETRKHILCVKNGKVVRFNE